MKQFSPPTNPGVNYPTYDSSSEPSSRWHEKTPKKTQKWMSHIPFKKHQIDELYIPVIPLNSISTYNLSIDVFMGLFLGYFSEISYWTNMWKKPTKRIPLVQDFFSKIHYQAM